MQRPRSTCSLPACSAGRRSSRDDFIDTLADVARRAPEGDGRDIDRVLGLLERYRAFVDDGPKVMANHDLNFGQGIWRGEHVVGLVDLEMAHGNSADWDLTDLLGMGADPGRTAPSDTVRLVHPADFTHVPVWFKEAYAEPFAHPALKQRHWVYELVYRLAELTQRLELAQMLAILEHGTLYEHLLPE